MLHYPQIAFGNANSVNDTIDTMVFKDPWNAVGCTNASMTVGCYIDGLDIRNVYIADVGQECVSGCGQIGSLANGIGSDVVYGQGTWFTLQGSNIAVHDDIIGESGIVDMSGEGCV